VEMMAGQAAVEIVDTALPSLVVNAGH
jgi:hypothetical protein